jgi:hypothetical protein
VLDLRFVAPAIPATVYVIQSFVRFNEYVLSTVHLGTITYVVLEDIVNSAEDISVGSNQAPEFAS